MKRILIVTGQSGSGKSSALQVLEDLGYYCIDNLPLALLPEIVEKLDKENNLELLALGVDIRSAREDLQAGQSLADVLQNVRTHLTQAGLVVDYVEARNPLLQKVAQFDQDVVLFVAAKLGKTRLIDNLHVKHVT